MPSGHLARTEGCTPYPIPHTLVPPPLPLDGYTPYPGSGPGERTPLYPIPQYPLHGVQRSAVLEILTAASHPEVLSVTVRQAE